MGCERLLSGHLCEKAVALGGAAAASGEAEGACGSVEVSDTALASLLFSSGILRQISDWSAKYSTEASLSQTFETFACVCPNLLLAPGP